MKRLASILALALAAIGAPTVASAHSPNFRIAGFQFTYATLFEEGGVAGYVSVPLLPPVHVGGTLSTSGGASTSVDDGIGGIANTDRVPHTFTECTSACDTATGSSAGAAFDLQLPAGATVPFTLIDPQPSARLEPRLYTFMCKIHPYMRGEISVSG